jgi:hypothetical protein
LHCTCREPSSTWEAAAPVYRRTLWSKDERRAFELRDRLRPLVARVAGDRDERHAVELRACAWRQSECSIITSETHADGSSRHVWGTRRFDP